MPRHAALEDAFRKGCPYGGLQRGDQARSRRPWKREVRQRPRSRLLASPVISRPPQRQSARLAASCVARGADNGRFDQRWPLQGASLSKRPVLLLSGRLHKTDAQENCYYVTTATAGRERRAGSAHMARPSGGSNGSFFLALVAGVVKNRDAPAQVKTAHSGRQAPVRDRRGVADGTATDGFARVRPT